MATPKADLDHVYRRSQQVVSRRIADEMVLVPIRQKTGDLNSIYVLNDTAATAWEALNGSISLRQVLEHILIEFDVEETIARQDLLELASHLEELGAIERIPQGGLPARD